MMYGFEYALHADVITVAEFGVAPGEDIDGRHRSRGGPLVVIAPARRGLFHGSGRTLQRDGSAIEVRWFGNK